MSVRGRPLGAASSLAVRVRFVAAFLALVACAPDGAAIEPRDPSLGGEVGRPGPLATATAPPAEPSATPTRARSPQQSAHLALEVYLDGLAEQSFGVALAASSGAARHIALVRMILAEHNRSRGAPTTVAIVDRSFAPLDAGPVRVSFRGSASIRSTVKGGGPSETSTRTLADPVVERIEKRWVVTSFSWDGGRITGHEGSAVVTYDGIEMRLVGAVAFGDVIGVIVLLVAGGTHSVELHSDRLRIGDAEAASGFRTLIDGQPGLLYLSYPRRDEEPDSLQLSVSVDGGPATQVSLDF